MKHKGGTRNMRIVAIVGSSEYRGEQAKAVVLEASRRFAARSEQVRTERRVRVLTRHRPVDRSSIQRLVTAIEARLVSALWTLSRLPNGGGGGRCGLAYIHDRTEIFANAVAAGEWRQPHPGAPSPKEIDAMHEPLSWLAWLPREFASIVRAAAASKAGEVASNVSWGKVRSEVPEAQGMTVRTLQRRYEAGLRAIAIRKAV